MHRRARNAGTSQSAQLNRGARGGSCQTFKPLWRQTGGRGAVLVAAGRLIERAASVMERRGVRVLWVRPPAAAPRPPAAGTGHSRLCRELCRLPAQQSAPESDSWPAASYPGIGSWRWPLMRTDTGRG